MSFIVKGFCKLEHTNCEECQGGIVRNILTLPHISGILSPNGEE